MIEQEYSDSGNGKPFPQRNNPRGQAIQSQNQGEQQRGSRIQQASLNFLSQKKKGYSERQLPLPKKQTSGAIVITDNQLVPLGGLNSHSPLVHSQPFGLIPPVTSGIQIKLEDVEPGHLPITRESQLENPDSQLSPSQSKDVTENKRAEESFLSNIEEDERDNLKMPSRLLSNPRPSSIGGASSIASSRRTGSRVIDQIDAIKLNKKRESSQNLGVLPKTMEDRKSKLLASEQFKMNLVRQEEHHEEQIEERKSVLPTFKGQSQLQKKNNLRSKAIVHANKELSSFSFASLIILPEDTFKYTWDVIITFTLVFTCLVVPVRIAFSTFDTPIWSFLNQTMDIIFIIDIMVTFNTAYYDQDFNLISDRSAITREYIRGWFFIDFLAVIPFDIFLDSSNSDVGRVAKLSRMYRLTKLTRLIRIMKIFKKSQGSIFKQAQEFLKISAGFERLVNFFLSFFLLCHIASCLWVIVAQFSDNDEDKWTDSFEGMDSLNLYVTSIYYTVTTITTVGYGDISGTNKMERIFCVLLMVAGVVAFSFASGSLASIIQNYDTQNAKLDEQLGILTKVYQDYNLPLDLFHRLKQSLQHNYSKDHDHLNQFLEKLPQNLRVETSLHIHSDIHNSVYFMKDKSMSLIAWICPLLKSYLVTPQQYIYFEGDEVVNISFMMKGSCGFVIPKFQNTKYINITKGCDFGSEDIIACILKNEEIDGEDWISHKDKLIRQFTVMADEVTELLVFSVNDLNRLQTEFLEAYNTLMDVACQRLEYALMIKLECQTYCQQVQSQEDKRNLSQKQSKRVSISERIGLTIRDTFKLKQQQKFEFQDFNLADLDEHEEEDSLVFIESEDDLNSASKRPSFLQRLSGSFQLGSRSSKLGLLEEQEEEEPVQLKKKTDQIGEIEEVQSDLEQSSDSREEVKEENRANLSCSSSSSFSSENYKSSDSSDSDFPKKKVPQIAVDSTESPFATKASPALQKKMTVRRQAQFNRLQTIMNKKDELLSDSNNEEKQQTKTFKRLQTVMKKNHNNPLDSSQKAKNLLQRLSESNDGTAASASENIISMLQTSLHNKFVKKKGNILSRLNLPEMPQPVLPNLTLNSEKVEKLLEKLLEKADLQASKMTSLEQKIEDMRFSSPRTKKQEEKENQTSPLSQLPVLGFSPFFSFLPQGLKRRPATTIQDSVEVTQVHPIEPSSVEIPMIAAPIETAEDDEGPYQERSPEPTPVQSPKSSLVNMPSTQMPSLRMQTPLEQASYIQYDPQYQPTRLSTEKKLPDTLAEHFKKFSADSLAFDEMERKPDEFLPSFNPQHLEERLEQVGLVKFGTREEKQTGRPAEDSEPVHDFMQMSARSKRTVDKFKEIQQELAKKNTGQPGSDSFVDQAFSYQPGLDDHSSGLSHGEALSSQKPQMNLNDFVANRARPRDAPSSHRSQTIYELNYDSDNRISEPEQSGSRNTRGLTGPVESGLFKEEYLEPITFSRNQRDHPHVYQSTAVQSAQEPIENKEETKEEAGEDRVEYLVDDPFNVSDVQPKKHEANPEVPELCAGDFPSATFEAARGTNRPQTADQQARNINMKPTRVQLFAQRYQQEQPASKEDQEFEMEPGLFNDN